MQQSQTCSNLIIQHVILSKNLTVVVQTLKFVFPTEGPYVRFVSIWNICKELRTHVVGSANNLGTSRSYMLRLSQEIKIGPKKSRFK